MKPFQIQFRKSILNKMIIISYDINCIKRWLSHIINIYIMYKYFANVAEMFTDIHFALFKRI